MLQILTPNGWSDFSGVQESVTSVSQVITGEFGINCTSDHLMETPSGFTPLSELKEGDKINTANGYLAIDSRVSLDVQLPVYDALNVDLGHAYFTNGVVSHNCHFRGSQNSLLPGHVLETMVAKPTVHDSDDYRVYADPIKGHTYLMTVDVSRGLGKDYSAFSIVDVSTTPYEVVAVYQNNKISPMVFPSIISAWGWKYNDAYVLVEINDIGEQVSTNLFYDLEYENLLMTYTDKNRQIIGFRNNPKTGVRTTTAVKAVGCSNIKTLIESGKLLVNDMETINEFGTFVPKGKSYEADSGAHDDLVMTMVLFAWATTQDYFIELTDSDVRASMQKEMEARAEEELVPFGIIDTDNGEFDGTAAMAGIDFGGF